MHCHSFTEQLQKILFVLLHAMVARVLAWPVECKTWHAQGWHGMSWHAGLLSVDHRGHKLEMGTSRRRLPSGRREGGAELRYGQAGCESWELGVSEGVQGLEDVGYVKPRARARACAPVRRPAAL